MPEAEVAGRLLLRVFTHPACGGCTTAVRQAWELTENRSGVALRTISLENAPGLAEARKERVTTIPTTILSSDGRELHRWVGTPEGGTLEAAVGELATTSGE